MSSPRPSLRYAILTHDHPFLHWDFLLEQGAACRTWRLMASPDFPGEISAEPLPDHRLIYLDYEGAVSGNRGSVTSWDSGTFEWTVDSPNLVQVTLNGHRLHGIVQVVQEGDCWKWSFSAT